MTLGKFITAVTPDGQLKKLALAKVTPPVVKCDQVCVEVPVVLNMKQEGG
ncbi:MAG: hypothetical protein ACK4EX_02220 [Thermaurantimonas sp.]